MSDGLWVRLLDQAARKRLFVVVFAAAAGG